MGHGKIDVSPEWLRVEVRQVWAVDIKNETFQIKLAVWFRWLSPEQDPEHESMKEGFDQLDVDWEPEWFPMVFVQRSVADNPPEWQRNFHCELDSMGQVWVYGRYLGVFKIAEQYDLAAFP